MDVLDRAYNFLLESQRTGAARTRGGPDKRDPSSGLDDYIDTPARRRSYRRGFSRLKRSHVRRGGKLTPEVRMKMRVKAKDRAVELDRYHSGSASRFDGWGYGPHRV